MIENCPDEGEVSRPHLKVFEPPADPPITKPYLGAAEFARVLGVSRATFTRWKKAKRLPRPLYASGWGRWSHSF